MNRSRILLIVGLFAVVLIALTTCGVNAVPTAEEEAKAKWADVQTDLQRREDLIPNLVETVRASAAQERAVLREVTEARASASQVRVTADQLTDPQAMARLAEAQTRLTMTLQRLQEAYPELRSQQNYTVLMDQLEGSENRIARSRQLYNEAVRSYNVTIRTFPSVVAARVIYGADPMQPFEASVEAQDAPRIDFGNAQ